MVPKVRSIPLVALLLLVLRKKKISREASKVTAIEHAKLQTMDSSPSYESTGSYQAFRLETKMKWNDKIFLNFLFLSRLELNKERHSPFFELPIMLRGNVENVRGNVGSQKKKRLESIHSSHSFNFHFQMRCMLKYF